MIEIPLTQGQVAYIDDCDADLTEFKWYAHWESNSYYARRTAGIWPNQKIEYLHRIILERKLGRKLVKGEKTDHIKPNSTLLNTRENLRIASVSQNGINRNRQINNTSGYKGVCYHKQANKWQAQIMVNGNNRYLSFFPCTEGGLQEAARERDRAAVYFFGEFASLNFPEEWQLRIQEIQTNQYRWMS